MTFLTKHSKFIYIVLGVLIAAMIISATFYATNYAHIHLFYSFDENGIRSVTADGANSIGYSNQNLFNFFKDDKATGYSNNFADYVDVVLKFQDEINNFNNLFITLEFISLIAFALLLVLSNQSRRIYYKSNLIGGVLLPLVIIVLNIVLLVNNLSVMGIFTKNEELFNIVSVLQNPTINFLAVQRTNLEGIKEWFNCNSLTFVVYTVFFIIVIAYSAFCSIYAILKYKATAEERNKILEKVVTK